MGGTYDLYVQDTPPQNKRPGTLWLKKDIGLLSIAMGENKYNHFSAGEGNLIITDGFYVRTQIASSTPPVSPVIGQLWLQDSANYWVFLGKWVPFGGN